MTEQFSVSQTAHADEPTAEPIAETASAPAFQPITDTSLPTQKEMRRAYSRCGWAIFIPFVTCGVIFPLLYFAVTFLSSFIYGFFSSIFPDATISIFGAVYPFAAFLGNCLLIFYNGSLLYTNELFIGLSLLLGAVLIFSLPKSRPERKRISPKLFFFLFLVTLFFSTVASLMGNLWELLLNGTIITTLPEAIPTQEISIFTLFSQIGPLQYFLCVGIIAPIIEELFFRKLLIDRLYRYGELGAILFSSVFFALFHQNVPQYFYTLLGGLLLGYLYCKTGSTLLVILLHMAFNIFSGVIPTVISLVYSNCLSVLVLVGNYLEAHSQSALAMILPATLIILLLFLIFTIFFLIIRSLLTIAGGALFFVYAREVKIDVGCTHLSISQKASSMLFNTGVIAAGLVAVILLVQSLT